jgi:hypothetical protein
MGRYVVSGVLAVLAAVRALPAEHLAAGPADGHVVVNVFKAGLFSGFAHDHHFAVTEWTARATVPEGGPGGASIELVLAAGSLHDTQHGLSDADRRKIDAQAAGPDTLDAAHHPRIELRSERMTLAAAAGRGAVHGTMHGTLTVRGRAVPVDVPFDAERTAEGWHARGTAHLKQTDLGIRPFSGFGGTVKVKDELTVDFELTLRSTGG